MRSAERGFIQNPLGLFRGTDSYHVNVVRVAFQGGLRFLKEFWSTAHVFSMVEDAQGVREKHATRLEAVARAAVEEVGTLDGACKAAMDASKVACLALADDDAPGSAEIKMRAVSVASLSALSASEAVKGARERARVAGEVATHARACVGEAEASLEAEITAFEDSSDPLRPLLHAFALPRGRLVQEMAAAGHTDFRARFERMKLYRTRTLETAREQNIGYPAPSVFFSSHLFCISCEYLCISCALFCPSFSPLCPSLEPLLPLHCPPFAPLS
jgi:hypothetical protein